MSRTPRQITNNPNINGPSLNIYMQDNHIIPQNNPLAQSSLQSGNTSTLTQIMAPQTPITTSAYPYAPQQSNINSSSQLQNRPDFSGGYPLQTHQRYSNIPLPNSQVSHMRQSSSPIASNHISHQNAPQHQSGGTATQYQGMQFHSPQVQIASHIQSLAPLRVIPLANANLDEELDRNLQEIRQIKYFMERISSSRFDIDEIFRNFKKHSGRETQILKSKEECCNSYMMMLNELKKISSKLLLEINPFPEENDINLTKEHFSMIENEILHVKKRETLESFGRESEKIKQYHSSNFPNLYEFWNRSKFSANYLVLYSQNAKFSVEQLKIALSKIGTSSSPCLILLCFDNELKYSELDDTFYICFILKELMTLTACFKKAIDDKSNELLLIHSFVWSTLFENDEGILKGFNNNNKRYNKYINYDNRSYTMPKIFNNFGDNIPEDMLKLREIVFKNYDKIKLPCLYPKIKILQNLTHALNLKYFTLNEVSSLIYNNKERDTLYALFDDALKFCEGIYKDKSKCAVCNERIQYDIKDFFAPVHFRDKNDKYSHCGCYRSNLKLVTSTPISIEIPFEENFVCDNNDSNYFIYER